MNLRIYLATINMTQKDFSSLLDVDQRYMSRIINNRVLPGKKLARNIEKLTHGQIKFDLPKHDRRSMRAKKHDGYVQQNPETATGEFRPTAIV